MWPLVLDQRFPWIRGFHTNSPAWRGTVADLRTGEQAVIRTPDEFVRFVAAHSGAEGHMGAGDAVRAVTKKLGMGECTPCAKRQAALNGFLPRLFRR